MRKFLAVIAALICLSAYAEARTVLNAPLNLTVNRNTGNDANNGGPSDPFRTIQRAVDVAANDYDTRNFNVTIQVQPIGSHYPEIVILKSLVGNGVGIIVGDETTPANVTINPKMVGHAFLAEKVSTIWTLKGFKCENDVGYGACIKSTYYSKVQFQNFDFGQLQPGSAHMEAQLGTILASGHYDISGGASYHYLAIDTGGHINTANKVVEITSPTDIHFDIFAFAKRHGDIMPFGMAWVNKGKIKGKRFYGSFNGTFFVNTTDPDYFPGDIPGHLETGAQYGG